MNEQYRLCVLSGDGIGPEVVNEAIKVLKSITQVTDLEFEYVFADIGGVALSKYDDPLPQQTLDKCKSSHAVLLGAIGDPKWDNMPAEKRPEKGLLGLRNHLKLYANLRPAKVYKSLLQASSLKKELVEGIDILIVRELTGGIYFGDPQGDDDENGGRAWNTMIYTREEIERIAHVAFQAAQKRNKRLVSVDKANVLRVSQLWRKVVTDISTEYPDIELSHMYVDNAAMQLVRYPKQFDVILTGNLFGDILSDEAAMLTGSLGMLPSASLGAKTALYEPVHGSAPDIAGDNKANPIATIASVALLLKHSFNRTIEATAIESAIEKVLEAGYRTADIANRETAIISTQEMGDKISKEVRGILN